MPYSAAPKHLPRFRTPFADEDDRLFRWLLAILAAVVFEGALRKWVLPSPLHPVAFLAKDALIVAFMMRYPLLVRPGPVKLLRDLALAIALLLLPAFGFGLAGTAQASIVNYKNAFLWTLFAPHLALRIEPRMISRLTPWLAPLAAIMAVLGVVQYRSPYDAWINRDAWTALGLDSTSVTFGANGMRASGTFSFISGMALFAIFIFQFSLWRFLNASGRRERNYAGLGLIAAVACGVTSGSRSTVMTFVLTLILALATSLRASQILRFIPIIVVAVLAFAYAFPDVAAAFVTRWATADDSTMARMTGRGLRANYLQVLSDNPFGVGLGQKTGYGVAVGQVKLGAQYQTGYDDGGSNALLEAGVLGLFAMGLTMLVFVRLFVHGFLSRNRAFRLNWACLGALPAYFLACGRWYDHIGTAFFWLSIAIWLSTDPEFIAARARQRRLPDGPPRRAYASITDLSPAQMVGR